MFCELFGPLVGLDDEWRKQGASEDEIAMTTFDWDYVLRTHVGENCGAITGLEPTVIEETPQHIISIDSMGRKNKLCKGSATISLPIEYPVRTADDWEKIRHWYNYTDKRIDRDALLKAKKLQQEGCLAVVSIPGGFDEPRQLMGEEELCIACCEQPELIEDMLLTMSRTAQKVFEQVCEVLIPDCLSIHEDMAGKTGPLFGPAQVQQFMRPYYRSVWEPLKSAGCRIFSQDSDGNMNPVIDALLDCGVTSLYPCEPAAGMNIVEIRKKYGKRLSLKGGIDKFALRGTKDDIRNELEKKITPITKGGGTVFALDHRIPNGVPIENYRYYVNYARELLGLEPISGSGWARMAF